jgi:putative Mn2+ efflux pump MntP
MKGLNIMGFLTLLLIAVGLSMDAFAVSVSSGMALCFTKMRQNLRIAGSFGLFQGIMPLLGYAVANTFSDKFEAIDHWIAFGLLGFVGGKMLWEALRGGEDIPSGDLSSWRSVMLMSVATSIDALAVGASFAVMPHEGILALRAGYLLCAAIIAVVTFVLCFGGVILGCRFGNLFGNKAEIAGGVVLIGIGIKILLEHTIFA